MCKSHIIYELAGDIKTREEFILFDHLQNIGFYPFTLIQSFYYGVNKICFTYNTSDNFIEFGIITNKKFIEDVAKYYTKFNNNKKIKKEVYHLYTNILYMYQYDRNVIFYN